MWTDNGDGSITCTGLGWVQGYILPPSAEGQLDLLVQGGFSEELFQIGFGGTLTLFALGFGIGLIISQIRKLRVR